MHEVLRLFQERVSENISRGVLHRHIDMSWALVEVSFHGIKKVHNFVKFRVLTLLEQNNYLVYLEFDHG